MTFRSATLISIAAVLSLAACGRPMTEGEVSFSSEILTRQIDFDVVRFSGQEERGRQLAKRQLEADLKAQEKMGERTEGTERLLSGLPALFGASAMVIGNTVFFDRSVYSADFSASPIDGDRWLMAHELTHVWQWQNSDLTGYSFAKVVSEHIAFGNEVYLYKLTSGKAFTDYRFEQQGKIVECYAMLRQVHPNHPVTQRHERLIRAQFPIDAVLKYVGADDDEVAKVRDRSDYAACLQT